MAEVRNEPTTRDLVSQLTRDMGDLVRQEVDLAKTETSEKLTQLVMGLVLLLVGLLTAFAALIILLDAGVYALAEVLPAWASAVIVGGLVAAIGLFIAMRGIRNMKSGASLPSRTLASFDRNRAMVKERLQ